SNAQAPKSQASSRKRNPSKTFTFTTSMDKMPSAKIQSNPKRLCVALLLGALWLAGCGKPKLEPVEIAAGGMCAVCKRAVSEKKWGEEFIRGEGEVLKLDDMGFVVNELKTRKNRRDVAAFFVVDYDSRRWVNAEQAYFANSEEFKTPMSGRIVAFKDRSKAK